MPPPSNILYDFDAALTAHIASERQQLVTFLVDVATLCNRHGTQQSIEALRSLTGGAKIPKIVKMSTVLDPAITPSGEDPSSAMWPGAASMSMSMSIPCSADVDDVDVPPNVADDFAIDRLAFLGADGEIHPEIPISDRMFGSRFTTMKKHFHDSLSHWRPHNDHLKHFADSSIFHLTSAAVILANFIFMVALTNWKVDNAGKPVPGSFLALGYCFMGFYVFELILQMSALGGEFFTGSEAGWNIFDFAIVTLGLIELAIKLAGANFVNTSFLRVLRFARVSRLLRMFSAMRLFKEIKIMVDCLSGSFTILFFCMSMFVMLLAMFSVFFVQGVATFLEDNADSDPVILSDLKESFGSVWACMQSLFFASTAGEALVYYNLTAALGDQYKLLFLFFISFYHFSFFNVIVGVFCEKALHLTKPTTDELMHQRYEKEFQDARELYALLHRCIDHGDCVEAIDIDRFKDFMSHPEVERYLTVRGLKHFSAVRFFRVLCEVKQSSSISFPDFVSALVKLDGNAGCIDQHVMSVRQLHGLHRLQSMQRYQHKDIKHVTNELHGELEKQLLKISTLLEDAEERTLTSIRRISNSEATSTRPSVSLTEPSVIFGEDGVKSYKKANGVHSMTPHEAPFPSTSEDLHAESSLQSQSHQDVESFQIHRNLQPKQNERLASRESKDSPQLDMVIEANSQAMMGHSQLAVEKAERRVAVLESQLEAQKHYAEELRAGIVRQQLEANQAIQDVVDKAEAREAKLKAVVQSQSRQLLDMTHKQLRESPGTGANASAGFGASMMSCAVPRACNGNWTAFRNDAQHFPETPSRIGNDGLQTAPQSKRFVGSGLQTDV